MRTTAFQCNIKYLHSTICLRPDFLVHLDEATTVVDKHTILVAAVQVHTEDEVQAFGVFQGSGELNT